MLTVLILEWSCRVIFGLALPVGCQGALSVEPNVVLYIWLPSASSWHPDAPPLLSDEKEMLNSKKDVHIFVNHHVVSCIYLSHGLLEVCFGMAQHAANHKLPPATKRKTQGKTLICVRVHRMVGAYLTLTNSSNEYTSVCMRRLVSSRLYTMVVRSGLDWRWHLHNIWVAKPCGHKGLFWVFVSAVWVEIHTRLCSLSRQKRRALPTSLRFWKHTVLSSAYSTMSFSWWWKNSRIPEKKEEDPFNHFSPFIPYLLYI